MKERKVLVPLDGSPVSTQTVQKLIALQDKLAFPMTLLHVLDLSLLSYRGFAALSFAEIENRAREKASQFVADQQRQFAAAGMPVATVVKEGHVIETICKVADSGEYGLLVIGRTPADEKQRRPFGLIANEIIQQVQCPVLIV